MFNVSIVPVGCCFCGLSKMCYAEPTQKGRVQLAICQDCAEQAIKMIGVEHQKLEAIKQLMAKARDR